MIEAAGWALVAGCLMVTGPGCNGRLATGMVWGDQEGCELELKREQIPGTQCMKIRGIEAPAADTPMPGMDEVISLLDEEASNAKF